VPGCDLTDHGGFEFAKPRLALLGEDLRDRPTGHRLDGGVRIDEAVTQRLGQRSPDGTLAGPHHAHQVEVEAFEAAAQR